MRGQRDEQALRWQHGRFRHGRVNHDRLLEAPGEGREACRWPPSPSPRRAVVRDAGAPRGRRRGFLSRATGLRRSIAEAWSGRRPDRAASRSSADSKPAERLVDVLAADRSLPGEGREADGTWLPRQELDERAIARRDAERLQGFVGRLRQRAEQAAGLPDQTFEGISVRYRQYSWPRSSATASWDRPSAAGARARAPGAGRVGRPAARQGSRRRVPSTTGRRTSALASSAPRVKDGHARAGSRAMYGRMLDSALKRLVSSIARGRRQVEGSGRRRARHTAPAVPAHHPLRF